MGARTGAIARKLAEKGAETSAFFRSLSENDWRVQVYADGPGWDVHHVLAHFVSAEESYLYFLRREAAGGEGIPEDFDIDHFNAVEVAKLAKLPQEALLERYESARAQTVAFVLKLDDSDMDRIGRHPFFGFERVEKILKLMYRHNMIHERDVRRALGGAAG